MLKVDGKEVATQKMERTIPIILQWDETFDIGSDTGTPVDDSDYQVPFTFTGKLAKLDALARPAELTPADEQRPMPGHRKRDGGARRLMKARSFSGGRRLVVAAAAARVRFVPLPVSGQGGAAKPGSPAYTAPLARTALPPATAEVRRRDHQTVDGVQAVVAAAMVPPKGAPNVLLDHARRRRLRLARSTFGGTIPTPDTGPDRQAGLRYTHFHSPSLCSPTRAALITGRNHHSVAFGIVAEGATGFPGYDSIVKKDTATIGTILRDNGYGTSWFGKNHNVPGWLATQAGPFDQWPVGMGFDYFYGFVGGDSSQWQPNLSRNTTPIAPYEGNPAGTSSPRWPTRRSAT